jgi:5'-methylthioinosine phosphorylase
MLGIIGGSGLAGLRDLGVSRRQFVSTPYGKPSGALVLGSLGGHDMVFLARHGEGHTIPPHEINYRANVWALHSMGAARIIAIATVGGIRSDLAPGSIAIPDQILDYTHGRQATYFTQADRGLRHIDFTLPYCRDLRTACLEAAMLAGVSVVDGGTYAATQGPRLETAAEIIRLERDGADMVGMTGMPEAVLARELGLSYAAIVVIANHAAGKGSSRDGIAMEEMERVMNQAMEKVQLILTQLAARHGG